MHATAVTVACSCAYVAARQSGARSHTVAGHCQPCHDHDTETKNKEPASLTTVVCQAFRLSLSAVLLFVFGDCKLETPSRNRMAEDRCSSSAKQAHISSQLSIPVTVRCCRMDHLCFACAPSFSTRLWCGRLVVGSDTLPRLSSCGHSFLLQLWCCLHPSIHATALILVLI